MTRQRCSGSEALSSSEDVLIIRSDQAYRTIEELQKAKRPVFLGAMPGTTGFSMIRLLMEVLDLPGEIIRYRSGAEVDPAIERGEVDGRAASHDVSHTEQGWIDRKVVSVFMVDTETRHPGFLDVSTVFELAPEHKEIIEPATAQNSWTGAWALGPGVPRAGADAAESLLEDGLGSRVRQGAQEGGELQSHAGRETSEEDRESRIFPS